VPHVVPDGIEEKNILAEAYTRVALLIMENKRLKSRLAARRQQLAAM
jgi:2-phosphoglycerate kinase